MLVQISHGASAVRELHGLAARQAPRCRGNRCFLGLVSMGGRARVVGAGLWGIPPEALGDLILVASAGLWSLVMIRQSRHAPAFPAFDLGTIKVCALSCLGLCAVHPPSISTLSHVTLGLHQGFHAVLFSAPSHEALCNGCIAGRVHVLPMHAPSCCCASWCRREHCEQICPSNRGPMET